MMMGTRRSSNLNVFTAAQREELEQQALIYKYMLSGVPVPTYLILSVTRSLYNSSTSSSLISNQPPNLGVAEGSFQCNQLYEIAGGGCGRKIDLEPGRCRRTDGKKWRCSKEVYADSKYCERHIHRGRNRSRKPLEFSSYSNSSASNISSSASITTTTTPPLISKSISPSDAYQNTFHPRQSSSKPPVIHPSFVDSSSNSHQTLQNYRYLQGIKDSERSAYFQPNDPSTAQKMAAGSSSEQPNYSYFNFQFLNHQDKEEETQGDGRQHCHLFGTHFIKETTTKVDETTHNKHLFHHFFSPPTTPNPNQDPNWVDQNEHSLTPPKSPLCTQDQDLTGSSND